MGGRGVGTKGPSLEVAGLWTRLLCAVNHQRENVLKTIGIPIIGGDEC